MKSDYVPIACLLHEQFEYAVLKRAWLELVWRDEMGLELHGKVRPEDFERLRLAAIDEFIESAPEERRQRLRCLQWRIDQERRNRCQPWRAKRRLVVPGSREAALLTRRALRQRGSKVGIRARRPVIGSWQRSGNELARLSRSASDRDGRGTNRLSKAESILGTGMSQNLSRGRRLTCVPR
ncbi:hypothetical protein DJ031_05220 [bacterium endosymbiont of Escarpia laminata]|nr:MAG: hypothetical protein DJ031_05220 [bacterium endosymbiont of Escarpia laminata]